MEDDIRALREEIAKLRERVAVLEAGKQNPGGVRIDWSKPLMVGTPKFLQIPPIPRGTITC